MTVRCVPVLAQGVPVLVQGVPVSARVYHIWYTAGPLVLYKGNLQIVTHLIVRHAIFPKLIKLCFILAH